MRQKFVFWCDCNEIIGFGHFVRCLSIARIIQSYLRPLCEIVFFGNYNQFAKNLLSESGFEIACLRSEDIKRGMKIWNYLQGSNYFIMDTYDMNEKLINSFCGQHFKFIVVDDFNKFKFKNVDLVINFTIEGPNYKYLSKNVALGVNFFPAKLELLKIRKKNERRLKNKVKSILILMGGSDRGGIGKRALLCIDRLVKHKEIYYVNNEQTIKNKRLFRSNFISYQRLTPSIENVYRRADVAILGGGLSKYESLFCCIPSASFSRTRGEYNDTLALSRKNLIYNFCLAEQFSQANFEKDFTKFLSFPVRKKLYLNMKNIFFSDSMANLFNSIIYC